MRKILILIFVTIFPLVCVVTDTFASEQTMYVLCDPSSSVNVRSTPSTKLQSEGRFSAGDKFVVDYTTKDNQNRTWMHSSDVALEVSEGWILSYYLCDSEVTVREYEGIIEAKGRIKVRIGVNAPQSKIKRWLKPKEKVTVYAQSDDWAYTNVGYVMTKFISEQ